MAKPFFNPLFWITLIFITFNSNASYEKILSLAKAGDIEQARIQSLNQLRENPNSPRYLLLAGKLSSNGVQAIKYYQTLQNQSKKSPEQEEAIYRLAQVYYAQGQYRKATSYYRKILEQYPTGSWSVLSRYWIGLSYLIIGKKDSAYLDSAEKYYTDLLTTTPNDPIYQSYALEGLIQVWVAQNKNEQAIDGLRMSLEDPSTNSLPTFYLQAIKLYQGTGRKQALNNLLKQFPNSAESKYILQKTNATTQFNPKEIQKNSNVASITKQVQANKTKASSPHYYLQLGVYSSVKNAKNSIQNTSYPVASLKLQIKKTNQKTYRILSQPFSSKEKALLFGKRYLMPKKISYYLIAIN